MKNNEKPHFIIKNHFQKKPDLYSELLTEDILKDICQKITGRCDYTCFFDDEGYNKGRLAILKYENVTTFISFSETEANGRNSSFQSVPSALNSYYLDAIGEKRICFYFLPAVGHIKTFYFMFMYRLMITAGIEFLNADSFLGTKILPFSTVEDIIAVRNLNRGRNKSNNSTYVTISDKRVPQIYGKTYGASKYETTLFAVALSKITNKLIELYEIQEKDLKELPKRSLDVIQSLGIKIIPTSLTFEKNAFEKDNSLRSPRYIYNLLSKLGPKKCAFCGCEIPELIQGAHIWPVSDIKKEGSLSFEKRLKYATDGDNGLWLCENHHKMFDEGIIVLDAKGNLSLRNDLEKKDINFIEYITPIKTISNEVLNKSFISYLNRRYDSISYTEMTEACRVAEKLPIKYY
ncbi:hypothetical protein DSECCO2_620090 [anaerobic digester metagenome]